MSLEILIVYYSLHGHTAQMAKHVARGVEEVEGVTVRLRTVPPVTTGTDSRTSPVPEAGPPYARNEDLAQ